MPPHDPARRDTGFTLVEILVAIVLVGILSTVAVVAVGGVTSKGSGAACAASADAARTGSTVYLGSTGSYPTTITDMTTSTPTALELSSGVTVDAAGLVATGNGWTMSMVANTSGPPSFVCSTDVPPEWTMGPNGHYYRYVTTTTTWVNALTAAQVSVAGQTGYLATITSAAEQAFIASLTGGAWAWLGGTDGSTEGTWVWTTGPEAGTQFWSGGTASAGGVPVGGQYQAWPSNQPDDSGNEDCLHVYGGAGWNDNQCTASLGYVVELGGSSPPSCATMLADATSAATGYLSSNGASPTSFTQLQAAGVLPLPAGVTVNPTGYALNSGALWNLALVPGVGGAAPAFLCSTDTSTGWTVGRNGHLYRMVATTAPWATAATNAATYAFGGRTGYLATVTSAGEATTVVGVTGGTWTWLGGNDAGTEGVWLWTTGPESGTQFWSGGLPSAGGVAVGGNFTNWSVNQPDNSGNEDCLHAFGGTVWNDLPCTNSIAAVVELGL